MRSSEQISRTPYEYADYKRAELARARADALRHFAALRRDPPEWYRWATEGQRRLSQQEYAQVGIRRSRKPASK